MDIQHETRPNDTRREVTDCTPQIAPRAAAPDASPAGVGETPLEASRRDDGRVEDLADHSDTDTMDDTDRSPHDHIQPRSCPYCGDEFPNNYWPAHIATCDERPDSGVGR